METLIEFIQDVKSEITIDSRNSSTNDSSIKTSTNRRFRSQIKSWTQKLKLNKFQSILEEASVKSSNRNGVVDRPRKNPYLNPRRWADNPFRIRGGNILKLKNLKDKEYFWIIQLQLPYHLIFPSQLLFLKNSKMNFTNLN